MAKKRLKSTPNVSQTSNTYPYVGVHTYSRGAIPASIPGYKVPINTLLISLLPDRVHVDARRDIRLFHNRLQVLLQRFRTGLGTYQTVGIPLVIPDPYYRRCTIILPYFPGTQPPGSAGVSPAPWGHGHLAHGSLSASLAVIGYDAGGTPTAPGCGRDARAPRERTFALRGNKDKVLWNSSFLL
jgi:hypothetical protein